MLVLLYVFSICLALKFIHIYYFEKVTKFCEISIVVTTQDKSKVEILKKFVAFSEYMNFTTSTNYLIMMIWRAILFRENKIFSNTSFPEFIYAVLNF